MKEIAHRNGAFSGWQQKTLDLFVERAIYALRPHHKELRSVSCAIAETVYNEMLSEAEKDETRHPYLLCLRQCGGNSLKILEGSPDGTQIQFVFDQRKKYVGLATETLLSLRTNPTTPAGIRSMISTATPGDDKKLLPLQAADLFAYEINKHFREPSRRRKSLKALNIIRGLHTEWWNRASVVV